MKKEKEKDFLKANINNSNLADMATSYMVTHKTHIYFSFFFNFTHTLYFLGDSNHFLIFLTLDITIFSVSGHSPLTLSLNLNALTPFRQYRTRAVYLLINLQFIWETREPSLSNVFYGHKLKILFLVLSRNTLNFGRNHKVAFQTAT